MKKSYFSKVIIFIYIVWLIVSSVVSTNLSFIQPQHYGLHNSYTTESLSCTIFTANIGDTVYFGNNEDYFLEKSYIWIGPSQEITIPSGNITLYGFLGIGFSHNNDLIDGFVAGGMNDQGLCMDGNGLPWLPLSPHPERESPWIYYSVQVLLECTNVSEVIHWYQNHNLGTTWEGQWHYADASGNAVVVSAGTDFEFNFTRKLSSHYLVSTNFNLANPSNGWYPCERYTTATTMLENITTESELTIGACRDILDAVHNEGYYATKYSNIFDPLNLKIHLYHNRNFDKKVTLDLVEEIGKVHQGGENVIKYSGVYFKEISIASLFAEDPIIAGYPLIILIPLIAVLSLVFILSKRKK